MTVTKNSTNGGRFTLSPFKAWTLAQAQHGEGRPVCVCRFRTKSAHCAFCASLCADMIQIKSLCPSIYMDNGQLGTPKMFARLNQINAEIADVERLISSKNLTIISALKKGTDTLDEENEVGVLNKALQLKKGARRKLMSELRILEGAALA